MNHDQLQYILENVLDWSDDRKKTTTEYFTTGVSCRQLQLKYCPTHMFTVSRDVLSVQKIYNQAFNIINASDL